MATRLDNLKVPTSEQARENGRKGGIRSAQVKKEKKRATEAANIMMSMPIVGKSHDKLIELGLQEEDLTNQWPLIIAGLIKKAAQGDVKAINKLLELNEEQTSKLIELKEKELKLKEREIRLKEEALKKEMASDDKVTIINDLLYEDDKDQ